MASRDGDANMRSVWICSRNDAIGNVAVVAAAMGVFGTGTAWPDLIVASIMALLSISAAVQITRHALDESGVDLLAVLVNRADADRVDEIRDAIRPGRHRRPVYVLPELPELALPSVAEVADALGLDQVAGRETLDRDVAEQRVETAPQSRRTLAGRRRFRSSFVFIISHLCSLADVGQTIDQLACQVDIGRRPGAAMIIDQRRQAMARRLGQAHIARNAGAIQPIAKMLLQLRRYIVGQTVARIIHGAQQAFDF